MPVSYVQPASAGELYVTPGIHPRARRDTLRARRAINRPATSNSPLRSANFSLRCLVGRSVALLPVPATSDSLKRLRSSCRRGFGDGGGCWGWEEKQVGFSLQADFEALAARVWLLSSFRGFARPNQSASRNSRYACDVRLAVTTLLGNPAPVSWSGLLASRAEPASAGGLHIASGIYPRARRTFHAAAGRSIARLR